MYRIGLGRVSCQPQKGVFLFMPCLTNRRMDRCSYN